MLRENYYFRNENKMIKFRFMSDISYVIIVNSIEINRIHLSICYCYPHETIIPLLTTCIIQFMTLVAVNRSANIKYHVTRVEVTRKEIYCLYKSNIIRGINKRYAMVLKARLSNVLIKHCPRSSSHLNIYPTYITYK